MVRDTQVVLISNKDLKNLRLLHQRFPDFLGDNFEEAFKAFKEQTQKQCPPNPNVKLTSFIQHDDIPYPDCVTFLSDKEAHMSVSEGVHSGGHTLPQDGPSTQQHLFSPIVEVEIDESAPEKAEEEAAMLLL